MHHVGQVAGGSARLRDQGANMAPAWQGPGAGCNSSPLFRPAPPNLRFLGLRQTAWPHLHAWCAGSAQLWPQAGRPRRHPIPPSPGVLRVPPWVRTRPAACAPNYPAGSARPLCRAAHPSELGPCAPSRADEPLTGELLAVAPLVPDAHPQAPDVCWKAFRVPRPSRSGLPQAVGRSSGWRRCLCPRPAWRNLPPLEPHGPGDDPLSLKLLAGRRTDQRLDLAVSCSAGTLHPLSWPAICAGPGLRRCPLALPAPHGSPVFGWPGSVSLERLGGRSPRLPCEGRRWPRVAPHLRSTRSAHATGPGLAAAVPAPGDQQCM